MVDRSSPTAATTGPAAGRLSKLHLHICCSPLGSVAVAATGPDTGLHGLSEHERYFFETKGYLVVPDMLTPAQVDQMNEASAPPWLTRECSIEDMDALDMECGGPPPGWASESVESDWRKPVRNPGASTELCSAAAAKPIGGAARAPLG